MANQSNPGFLLKVPFNEFASVWYKLISGKTLLSLLFVAITLRVNAQKNCGTDTYKDLQLTQYQQLEGRLAPSYSDPLLKQKLASLTGLIAIPLSVHVIYNTDDQKLSQELIEAQVAQLNKDFSGTNEDRPLIPEQFKRFDAVDCGIRFVLKKLSYKHTDSVVFNETRALKTDNIQQDQIKFNATGGENGDADTQFLNIWIGNITDNTDNQLLGYSSFPGGIDKYDGIVIHYEAIGPQIDNPAIKGRTLTHEVGHWLNLFHLWGDDDNKQCGDDLVSDTPMQAKANSIPAPHFPHCTCGNLADGDMFMDFMDYTEDSGMFMFTQGQKDRMRLNFVEGGKRVSFLHNSVLNELAVIDTGVRKDRLTPVISYVQDLKVAGNVTGKVVKWMQQPEVSNYIIQARRLGGGQWKVLKSKQNQVALNQLKQNAVYEIKIQSVDNKGQKSTESSPYLFKTAATVAQTNKQ